MRLFRRRPESGNVESVIEVCTEVVHPTYREEDVCAELERFLNPETSVYVAALELGEEGRERGG